MPERWDRYCLAVMAARWMSAASRKSPSSGISASAAGRLRAEFLCCTKIIQI